MIIMKSELPGIVHIITLCPCSPIARSIVFEKKEGGRLIQIFILKNLKIMRQ